MLRRIFDKTDIEKTNIKVSFSSTLEETLHRAIEYANERRHEYATLEHLLLSLIDDQDAAGVIRACIVDLVLLRYKLTEFVDKELTNLVLEQESEAQPTASFQRVIHRAVVHVQSSGREVTTGANVLVAIFAERESAAAQFLVEQDMTRFDAVNFISHGISKTKLFGEENDPYKQEEQLPLAGIDKAEAKKIVFISHCNEDKRIILPVIQSFIEHGFFIWIDSPRALGLQNHRQVRGIRASESWQTSIRNAIENSGCVVTFWSKAAAQPDRTELHEEARIAKKGNKLIQVSIDPLAEIDLPLGFSERQIISIADELKIVRKHRSIRCIGRY